MNSNKEYDNVNHPSHYCQDGSMECIEEMIAIFGEHATMDFCLLNVWKYRKRAVYKNGEEDIKKSDWYMKKYIELRDKLNDRVNKTKALTITSPNYCDGTNGAIGTFVEC